MAANRGGLPTPRVDDPTLNRWIELVSQQLGSTTRTAEDADRRARSAESDIAVISVAPEDDLRPDEPTAITPPLRGFAGIGVVALFWPNPFVSYRNHGTTLVYRHTADEFNNAVQIGQSTGISYVDRQVVADQDYFYWIVWESQALNRSNPSASVEATPSADPAVVVQELTNQIANDPLTRSILTEFANQAVQQQIAERVSEVTSYLLETIRDAALDIETAARTALGGRVTTTEADIAALQASVVGFMLGPTQNVFTGTDKAAAEAARDAYATANPMWLAMYDADDDLNIRLVYGVAQQYQRRVSSDWVDNGDERPTVQALQDLQTQITENVSDIADNAASIVQVAQSVTLLTNTVAGKADTSVVDALTTRVTANEAGIAANLRSITFLTGALDDKADASALASLMTSVTENAGAITAANASLISLTATVAGKADASALMALTSRVDTTESEITALQSEITELEAAIGGRTLGPEQNVFTGTDKAAAEAARDAYATANLDWLEEYDADNDINIELRWDVFYIYQRRLNNAWVDNGEALARAAAVSLLNMLATANQAAILANTEAITALRARAGRALGPAQNTFTGDDRDAAEAARDAYATANQAWLAMYDADPNVVIRMHWQ